MRKNLTLFTMVLLGSMAAAQAQNNTFVTTEMVTQPRTAARMGGESEMSGSVWLTSSTGDAAARTTFTLHYSAPLAEDMASSTGTAFTSANATVVGTAENDDNDGNGTVVVSGIPAANTTLVVRNVILDVSGASGPVTVTVEMESSDTTDYLRFDGPNMGIVISDVVIGIDAKADPGTLRTRGGEAMAELTLEEAFKDAFMTPRADATDDNSEVTPLDLEITFSGIPDGATLTAELVGIVIDDATATPAIDADNTDPYATVSAVSSGGKATVMLGGNDDMDERQGPDEVVLMLTLTAASSNDEISFPLDVGEVTAEVTFAGDNFDDVLTDPMAVFKIRPAQCELLFPVVTVMGAWNTAISVTNPAYEDEMASGGLDVHLLPDGGRTWRCLNTTVDRARPGAGLEGDGTLSPREAPIRSMVNARFLRSTGWGDMFPRPRPSPKADYTNCTGLGWVTDWMGVNQAYSAVGDRRSDTGSGE